MYKLVFFVPEDYLESVKNAAFNAGAGKVGHYDQCCWQTLGKGQFRPLAGSTAFIGQPNELTQVAEYRVEMVCADEYINGVISAMKAAHPYECPAYDVLKLENL